jgi:tetratricopeptide (TPR) repeat protein
MKNLSLYAEADDALTEALALRRANLPDSHPDVWKSELDLGRCKGERGDVLGGIERFRAVRASIERAGGPADLVLTARLYEGISLSAIGLPEATAVLNDVVAGREKLNGPNHKDTLLAKVAQVTNLMELGEWGEAVKRFAEFRRAVGEYPDARVREVFEPILDMQAKMAVANMPSGVGTLFAPSLRDTVKSIKADVARLEKQLTEDHLFMCIMRFELAKLMVRAGDEREGDATNARVLADVKKTVGLSHPKALTLVEYYGNRLAATKRADEGRALYLDAEAATRARFGADSPWLVRVLVRRARFEARHGAPAAAAASATEAAAMIARGAFVPTAAALEDLRTAAEALGKVVATRPHALKLLALSVAPVEKVHGETSVSMVVLLSEQGKQLYRAGDRAAALEALERAEALVPRVPALGPVGRNTVMYWRGKLELDRGRFADAERYLRPALVLSRTHADVRPLTREENAINLAIALAGQGRHAEGLPLMAEYQTSRKRLKLSDADAAAGEMLHATVALAAGARGEHEKLVRAMLARFNLKGAHGDVVARVGWAAALAPPAGWDAAAHAKLMTAAVAPWPHFTWGYQGLALVRLRAGDYAGYEAALKQAARPDDPLTLVIRGLANATGGNPAAARAYLTRAEDATEAAKPSAKNPFAYGDTFWYERVQYAALRDELRALLAPPTAPPPRPLDK